MPCRTMDGVKKNRMAMETMIVFARETGRTLVMPAAQKFYLLTRPAVEFSDMFPMEYLSAYMDVMSMEVGAPSCSWHIDFADL